MLSLSAGAAAFAKDAEKAPAKSEFVPNTGGPGQLSMDASVKLMVLDRYKSGDAKVGERVNLRVDEDNAKRTPQLFHWTP